MISDPLAKARTPCSTSAGSSPPTSWRPSPPLPDESVPALAALAHEVRLAWCGPEVEVEGILSAKTGGCPEDCHFCSQSATVRHPGAGHARSSTPTRCSPPPEETAAARRHASSASCSPSAGPTSARWTGSSSSCRWSGARRASTSPSAPASSPTSRPTRLADGGVHRYNHNLETARSFFAEIVTTHTLGGAVRHLPARPRATAWSCAAACCSGMGETDDQRLELLGQLREVEPGRGADQLPQPPARARRSADRPLVEPLEAIRWIALFRLGPARRDPALRRRPRGHPRATSRPWA